jgi:hypothetical protein
MGEAEDGRNVIGADPPDGVRGDILHAPAALENRSAVPQPGQVFFRGPNCHRSSLLYVLRSGLRVYGTRNAGSEGRLLSLDRP